MIRLLLIQALAAIAGIAAVDGTVTNGTTGKPQPGVIIQMVQPGQGGMQTLGTTKSGPDGSFRFDKDGPAGPRLLQAMYQGAMYVKMIPPNAPSNGLAITVHDATTDASVLKPTQHIFILQPSSEGISVEEVVFLKNDSAKTYNDPKGTFRFYLPDNAAGVPKVSLTSPDGMVPVQREATKTGKPNIYSVSYPMKPGETQIALSYAVRAGADRSYKGRLIDDAPSNRLVVPLGITADGDNLTLAGRDPQNKANIYDIKGKEFAAVLKGEAAAADAASGDSEEDTGAPQLETSKPRIYDRLPLVIGFSAAILLVGFILMYRATPGKGTPSK